MGDEAKKDSTTRDLPKEKVTAPVPDDANASDEQTPHHTGRQKKYDGGPVPEGPSRSNK